MNNNPVSYIDPDGRNPIAIGVFIGAAVLGGGGNLWSNWGKVKNFKQGAAYFASGAVGGAVSVVPGMAALGGSITAGGNLATDLATGNMPNFRGAENPAWEIAKYTGGLALDGFGAAGAGSLSKFGYSKLSPYFSSQAIATSVGTNVTKVASWQGGFANVLDEITVTPAIKGFGGAVGSNSVKLLNSSRGNLLNAAENTKLRSMIENTYRKGASIGSGSTGDAIRYELQGGKLVNSNNHFQKGQEALNSYRDLLKGNYGQLNNIDRQLIFEQIDDLTRGTGLNWKGLNFDYLKNIPR